MYYITKRDSETGKKIQQVLDKITECNNISAEESKKYGSTKWALGLLSVAGGISGVIEPNEKFIDKELRLDKKSHHNNLYIPNRRTKEGKDLIEKWDKFPRVTYKDLNNAIGYDEWTNSIGLNHKRGDYFGITVDENWNVSMPNDCEEITTTKYKEIFS